MITWLKIIFATIAIFVWFSIVGIAVCNFLKIDVKKYYFPVGLITIFGLYEIVLYYPIMYHLNKIYSGITIYLLIVITAIYGLFNFKKIVKELYTKQTIISLVIICLGFIITYFFNPLLDGRLDIEFYLSLIRSANELKTLGEIYRYQSVYGVLGGNHLLYGFYYFVGYLSKITRLDPYIFAVWVNPLVYLLFAGTAYLCAIEKIIDNKKIKLLTIVFIFLYVFCLRDMIYETYGNPYKQPMFTLMYLFLKDYKNSRTKKAITLFVFSAATLSVHQSSVFVLVGVIVAYFIYCSFNDNEELPYIFIWSIPTILNGLYIYGVQVSKLSFVYLFFVFIVNVAWRYKKEIIVKLSKFCSILAPILIVIASIYIEFCGKPETNIAGYFDIALGLNFLNFGFAIGTISNYINIIFLFIYLIYSLKNKNKSFYFYMASVGLFLYSPLTVDFVSTYMARGVYDRMIDLMLIPTYIIIFLNELNIKKILIVYICLEIITYLIWPFTSENIFVNNTYDHLFRTEKDLLTVARDVDNFALNNEEVNKNVFSVNLAMHSYTRNLIYIYNMDDWRRVYVFGHDDDSLSQTINVLSTKSKYLSAQDYNAELVYGYLYTLACPYFVVGTEQRDELYDDLDSKCQRISETEKYYGYYCEFDYLAH